jgi:hypothetical protein
MNAWKIFIVMALTILPSCKGRLDQEAADKKPSAGANDVYFELSFAGKENSIPLTHTGPLGSTTELNVIGTNGNGTVLYYQNNHPYIIGVLHLNQGQNVPVKAELNGLYLFYFDADLSQILPNNNALLVSTGHGIAEMANGKIVGLWKDPYDTRHLGSPKIAFVAAVGNQWVVFPNILANNGGYHRLNVADPLKQGPANPGQLQFNAIVGHADDLYLVVESRTGQRLLKYQGSLTGSLADAEQILSESDLASSGSSAVFNIAVAGDHLILGKVGTPNGAGLLNLSDKKLTWHGDGFGNVKNISLSQDKKSALMVTDQGLIFFYNGRLVKIADDYALLTKDKVSEDQPVMISNTKDADFDFTKIKSATHANGHWYVLTDKGVFKIKMEEKSR